MLATDQYVMYVLQTVLLFSTVYAAFRDVRIRALERSAAATAVVDRGDKSMAAIYTVYGATIASCLVLIDKATGLEGNRVVLIALDFVCITYLFFFSTWFRNSVFFPLYQRVRKD